jgi:hypothetical protein
MHPHIRAEQIPVDHNDPRSNAAHHGEKCNGPCNDMAFTEKPDRFIEMQTLHATVSQVGRIKAYEDGNELGHGMDAEEKCHAITLLIFYFWICSNSLCINSTLCITGPFARSQISPVEISLAFPGTIVIILKTK